MNQKLVIFYCIDTFVIIVSFILTVLSNLDKSPGYGVLESFRHFVFFGAIFVFSLSLLVIVTVIYLIVKHYKNKKQKRLFKKPF